MSVEYAERSYSSGTRPRSEGLFGLSWVGMLTVGAVVISVVLSQAIFGLTVAAAVLTVGTMISAPLVIHIDGRTGYVRAILLWQWWRGARRGEHLYRSGSFSQIPGGARRLPGVLAPSRLYSAQAVDGHWFGMIHMPKVNAYTIVLRAWPQGGEAVDQDLVDTWVAGWGAFLGSLGSQPDILAIVPVVETVPETGNRLMTEVSTLTRQDAPEIAQQVMWELGNQLAAQRVQLECRLAITFEATTPERRKVPAEQALEIGRRLPGIMATVEEAGVRVRPMDGHEIIAVVRRAYDPAAQANLETAATEADGHGLTWATAGPGDQNERRDRLLHCGAVSITWEMSEPPKGTFDERVLERLLQANVDLPRKRVAVVFRPHSAGEGNSLVDQDFRNALVKSQNRRSGLVSAEASIRVDSTQQAREELARGHGLTRYGLLVTVTAPHDTDLPRLEALTKDLTTQARLQIQRSRYYQAAAFAASVGIGVILPDHATVVEFLED